MLPVAFSEHIEAENEVNLIQFIGSDIALLPGNLFFLN